ncbi:hypothetical protein DV515_00005641 [Chloebia gouldiae]|uniref:Integrin beta subunit cytoplasmic domain-containing protein n=1 Tax=Chloebia gouldiae TaxID=44316 RepID=A0A3L8SML7_CHLGU|nr:hypothetical protein DV515_00005641 [Chloebia gouldiae]
MECFPTSGAPGHGECHCGECKCHAGFIGDNCNCSTEMDSCVSSDGQMCSGRGACVCGKCQCTEPGAFGETCEKCPTCPETDDPNAILCAYPVNNCVMKFTYLELPSGKSNLTVLKEPACSSAPSAVTIVLAVIGSVVLIGIILLALWKLLVTIHDRREFDRFQSERSRARYEMASNPLYRKPISTHNVEFTFNKLNKSYNEPGTTWALTMCAQDAILNTPPESTGSETQAKSRQKCAKQEAQHGHLIFRADDGGQRQRGVGNAAHAVVLHARILGCLEKESRNLQSRAKSQAGATEAATPPA